MRFTTLGPGDIAPHSDREGRPRRTEPDDRPDLTTSPWLARLLAEEKRKTERKNESATHETPTD